MTYSEAAMLLKEHGQEHLLKYYDELDENGKSALLDQISGINFSFFLALDKGGERKIGNLTPVPAFTVEEVARRREEFGSVGLAAIKAGKVAAVLLAGGQGTRLGSDNPKGMYNMGTSRELSIFACQFANIKQVTDKAGVYFHIFVMTSDVNNEKTVAFFKEKNY